MIDTTVLIVGAGPIGLELAAALKQRGVAYVQLEAGQVGQTIHWYPKQVKFFSSPDRIAIAGLPLQTSDQSKASREEYLAYLRGVVQYHDLQIQCYERVETIRKIDDRLMVTSRHGDEQRDYRAEHVVLAIGDMHRPRYLHIPGEDLQNVSHYFDEPHQYFGQRLLVVGGKNSAVEAALRCHRAGAKVSLSYRRAAFDTDTIKYWLMPELQVLIDTGKITFHPETVPTRIAVGATTLKHVTTGNTQDVPSDFVLLMTGYEMDTQLLAQAGIAMAKENHAPQLDLATMQTNVPGLYVAGTAAAGTQTTFRLFIENCHAHVDRIMKAITGRPCPFPADDVTTSEKFRLPES